MTAQTDELYMRRCLELARLGHGSVAPNPMVGSVIVHQGKVIGEGYHQKCGQAHAEVNAVNAVQNKALLTEATLYVNLEPCAHFGRTPPCSNLIIEHKIKRVVVGCIDTFSKVSGKGIERMQQAGIDVTVGVLELESTELNRRFFSYHKNKRPYTILKWAETQDGFIDAERSSANTSAAWITNEISRCLVHKWRTEEQAFMVGTRTMELDNPRLNVRAWSGPNPIRVTIDRDLSLPLDLNFFDGKQPAIVYTELKRDNLPNIEFVQLPNKTDLLIELMTDLYNREITSIVIEGGEILLSNVIRANLWDEALVFVGDRFFGKGTRAPSLSATPEEHVFLNESQLYYYKNNQHS